MLAAMFAKSGTGKDLVTLNERRRKLSAQMVALRNQQNRALSNGTLAAVRMFEPEWPENIPVLVMVPSSVTQNWMNEFGTWGHFGVALYHGGDRALSLERIRNGLDEVLICSKGVLVSADDMASLKSIPWKLIVVDEQHQQKNRKSAGFQALESLRETCQCPVLGMTGTVMQNNLEELWACVETVEPGFLETWESFKSEFATPIMLARYVRFFVPLISFMWSGALPNVLCSRFKNQNSNRRYRSQRECCETQIDRETQSTIYQEKQVASSYR
jgi:hypothetical protein